MVGVEMMRAEVVGEEEEEKGTMEGRRDLCWMITFSTRIR
jgi:hypothetical protein